MRRCDRCKRNFAKQVWYFTACALNRKRIELHLCNRCDVTLNYQSLRWIKYPKAAAVIERYKRKLYGRKRSA